MQERLAAFRYAVTALACLLGALIICCFPIQNGGPLWGIPFLLALATIAEMRPLRLPRYGAMSLADASHYAVAVLYGPALTLLSVGGAGASRFVREARRGGVSLGFVSYSIAQTLLSYGSGACCYALLAPHHWVTRALSLALAVLVTFLVQSSIVAVYQWLEQETVGRWRSRINWDRLRLGLQATGPLGGLMAVTLVCGPAAFALLLGPLAVTYLSIKNYTDTLREAREVIESLVEAVERREPHMAGHALRVAAYAADIARALGLEEGLVARVATAGRLHDLGKISIDETILGKAASLTQQETAAVRRHPEIGAEVAAKLSLSRQEAEFIRYHHEWYNGEGYPYGIQGESIPLGARILAVAEAFDTMLTPRAYGEPFSQSRALDDLRKGEGTQFDPQVVQALVRVLIKKGTPSLESAI